MSRFLQKTWCFAISQRGLKSLSVVLRDEVRQGETTRPCVARSMAAIAADSRPQLTVEDSIIDRFVQVIGQNLGALLQIRNGPRHTQDLVVSAGR